MPDLTGFRKQSRFPLRFQDWLLWENGNLGHEPDFRNRFLDPNGRPAQNQAWEKLMIRSHPSERPSATLRFPGPSGLGLHLGGGSRFG